MNYQFYCIIILAIVLKYFSQQCIPSVFVRVGCFALDEERLVLLKPIVHFSFIYGVLRGLLFNYLTLLINLLIYCEKHAIDVILIAFTKIIKVDSSIAYPF